MASRVTFALGAALLPYLVLLICRCGEVEPAPAPLLGLDLLSSIVDPSLTNSSSILGVLALTHLQHKLDALNRLGELFGIIGANGTLFRR